MKDEDLTEEHKELLAFADGGEKHCTGLSGTEYKYTKPMIVRAKKQYSRKVKIKSWGYGRNYKTTVGTNGDKNV